MTYVKTVESVDGVKTLEMETEVLGNVVEREVLLEVDMLQLIPFPSPSELMQYLWWLLEEQKMFVSLVEVKLYLFVEKMVYVSPLEVLHYW